MRRAAGEDQTLDLIYNAAVQPSLWPEVVDHVIAATGGEDGSITHLDVTEGTGTVVMCSHGDASMLNEYFAHFYRINPLQLVDDPSAYAQDWRPKIMLDEDLMPREDFERTEYFNDFIRTIGAEWGMIVRLGLWGTKVAAINVGRHQTRGRFEGAETRVAARLQPHLVRAYAMTDAFAGLQQLSSGLVAALNQSPSPMLLLDDDGRIRHANAAADRLLAQGEPLKACNGQLVAAEPVAAQRLAALIALAASADCDVRRGASLSLPRRNGRRPLTLTGTPLRMEAASAFVRGSAVLVNVSDPEAGGADRMDALVDRFDLTGAERRLASCLCEGLSLREASDRHAISVNTARVQLASVFAKTGTHRQIELVRLLTAG